MIWLLYGLGFVVALIAVVWIVGALVPLKHRASRTARFHQTPEAVFAAISDWRAFPEWRTDLKEVRPREGTDGRESWVEVSKFGDLPLEVVESDPPRRLVGRIVDPEGKLQFGGTWTYEIRAADGGCTLTITEDGEIYSAPFRFMARFVFGYAATMERYLKSLARKFGEGVEFEP